MKKTKISDLELQLNKIILRYNQSNLSKKHTIIKLLTAVAGK